MKKAPVRRHRSLDFGFTSGANGHLDPQPLIQGPGLNPSSPVSLTALSPEGRGQGDQLQPLVVPQLLHL